MSLSNVVEGIWTYGTRTLASGTPGPPTNLAEEIAEAVWQYGTRVIYYDDAVAAMPATTGYWKLDGDALDSIGTNHLTVNGATFGAAGPWTGATAASFDGVDDYLIRAIALSGDFTINTWVYLTADGNYPMIATFGSYAVPDLRFNAATRSPAFMVNSALVTVALNSWNMVTGVREGSNGHLYLNGALIASGDISSVLGDLSTIEIGRRFDGFYLPGRIARVSLHPVVLSQSNLALLYSSQREGGTTPPASPRGLRRRLLQSGHYLGI
jgi:hypothetical protein